MPWRLFRRNPPDDPWSSRVKDSDAHAAGTHPRRLPEEGQEETARLLKLRKRAVIIIALTLFALTAIGSLVGEGGVADKQRLRTELRTLSATVHKQEAEVANLREEIFSLQGDSLPRERIAREQLGLVREGEIDFLLPRKRPPAQGEKP